MMSAVEEVWMPEMKLPQIKLPEIKLPEIKLPEVDFSIITQKGGHRALITVNGANIETPPVEHLVYYAGIGVLVAVEIMEFPVAVVLTLGHLLIGLTHRPGLEALGEVLEET
jgi:hypothetical protein